MPIVIGGRMGFGSFLGVTSFFRDLHENVPVGDLAGAVGALIVLLCLLAGFGLALFVISVGETHAAERFKGVFPSYSFSTYWEALPSLLGAARKLWSQQHSGAF